MLPFTVPHLANQAANHAVNGVVVGVPLVVGAQQRMSSRRNSMSHAPRNSRQQAISRFGTRASLDDGEYADEELRRTHHELMEIEQQMLMMMGENQEDRSDDEMSIGSFGSSSDLAGEFGVRGKASDDMADTVDTADRLDNLHQDLSLYSSSFTNSHSKRSFLNDHQSRQIDPSTQCYVILFGMGSEETEGIYTLRTVESCEWSEGDIINVDTVVAFEDEVDAQRFATLLEASLRHQPAVYSTTWGDITEWSTENAARCRLEPAGSLLLPPESNVSVTDWERALALQRGQYTVLDEEPQVNVATGPSNSTNSTNSMSSCGNAGMNAMGSLQAELDSRRNLHSEPLSPAEEAELFRMDEVAFDGKFVDRDGDNVNNIVDSRMANSSLNSVREELEKLLGSSS